MREQLIQYVSLLFGGANNAEDVKQEILQNTLDRYDDMISQGKSPEAAYRLAISGIGDIREILGTIPQDTPTDIHSSAPSQKEEQTSAKLMRAIAVGLYILCPVPLFILDDLGLDTIGLCGTLALIAVATVLIIMSRKKAVETAFHESKVYSTPRRELDKSVNALIWSVGLAVYFIVSILTKGWFITWVIFPMIAAVQGIVKACMDLKEG